MVNKLKYYNENLTNELKTTNLLTNKHIKILEKNMNLIKHSMINAQIFRTDTEARISVLNDLKHPTIDDKYWQSIKELKVQSNELFYLNFDYRNKKIDIMELENKLKKKYNNKYEKMRDKIKLEKYKYELIQMEIIAKDRIREINMWGKIIQELEPKMLFSKINANEHQLLSYTKRYIKEVMTNFKTSAKYSSAEARNIIGLLQTSLKVIKEKKLQNKLLNILDDESKYFIINNNLLSYNK